MLFNLLTKGYSLRQASSILHVSVPTLSNDHKALRLYFKEQMATYIDHRLPELWESTLNNLHMVMQSVHKIVDDPETSTHDKLQALSLLESCSSTKLNLISDATVIQEALRFVDAAKQRIVEIAPNKAHEMLQPERGDNAVATSPQQKQKSVTENQEDTQLEENDESIHNSNKSDEMYSSSSSREETIINDDEDLSLEDNKVTDPNNSSSSSSFVSASAAEEVNHPIYNRPAAASTNKRDKQLTRRVADLDREMDDDDSDGSNNYNSVF
jgi:hypothetical protein